LAGATGVQPAPSRSTAECSGVELRPQGGMARTEARRAVTPSREGRSWLRRGLPSTDSAGGIRTHGLELMRLARTTPPLPRKSRRQDSNLRSPAPEAGGVASLPYSESRTGTPGGSRTRFLPGESRASSPCRPRGQRSEALESNQALLDISQPCRATDTGLRRLRRQGSNLRLAINSRASYRSTTPERRRKERESNPQGREAHPFSRRDTAPDGSPSSRFRRPAAGQGRERWLRQESNLHCAD
jgi:hypothetical protein